jgi:hypothetical protein
VGSDGNTIIVAAALGGEICCVDADRRGDYMTDTNPNPNPDDDKLRIEIPLDDPLLRELFNRMSQRSIENTNAAIAVSEYQIRRMGFPKKFLKDPKMRKALIEAYGQGLLFGHVCGKHIIDPIDAINQMIEHEKDGRKR